MRWFAAMGSKVRPFLTIKDTASSNDENIPHPTAASMAAPRAQISLVDIRETGRLKMSAAVCTATSLREPPPPTRISVRVMPVFWLTIS